MSQNTDRLRFVLLGVCLILSSQTLGQSIGGTFFGVVKDPTGVVPQAEVQITNSATGQVRFVFTDDKGTYELREVPPGVYELKVAKDGYNTVTTPPDQGLQLGLGQVSRVDDITLTVAPAGSSEIQVNALDLAMTDSDRPTLSTAFTERQLSGLPLSARDINNLAPLAPGVVSVSSFSFANTLVPFSVNGSRGRDNNFIIDSVDNNEPLFGGAATQFTNSEIFSEFRILTGQFQAEYGRNSGSIVNVVTKTGGKELHGSLFWYGQNDAMNAMTQVEKESRLTKPARFYDNQLGASVGGPIKKDSTWYFVSYQWDRARNDLSSEYPVVATLPTSAGLAMLQSINAATPTPTLTVFLADPTVRTLPTLTSPFAAPCTVPDTTNLNATNPCTTGSATWGPPGVDCSITPPPSACLQIGFGTYLVPRANVFDYRDHEGSGRIDQMLGQRDNLFFRYLLDDLRTPLGAVSDPSQVEFSDLGLLPQWRPILAQRTQNFGSAWTHAFDRALNELRFSVSRVSSERGPLDADPRARELPALTVTNRFDSEQPQFIGLFTQSPRPAPVGFEVAGDIITLGSDTRSSQFNTNLYQLQENFSLVHGRHDLKFGGNLIETRTDLRQINGDLGHYFYASFSDFVNNVDGSSSNLSGYQRFGNFGGEGGEVLPLGEFAQFYFAEDDMKLSPNFTLNLGIRYENYGQAYNAVVDRSASNPNRPPSLDGVNTNIAPRIGFAWGLREDTVLRGGYGIYYDPTFFNIPLLVWQSGPISPYAAAGLKALGGNLTSVSLAFPSRPFDSSALSSLAPYSTINQNTVSQNLRNPFVHNASLSLQHQFQKDLMLEVSYFGSRGTKLFQRRDLNPFGGWSFTQPCNPCSTVFLRPRINPNRGAITDVSNGGFSNYHALQLSGTKRLRGAGFWNGLSFSGAYTWSHMTDNASEIFGPGIQQAIRVRTVSNKPFDITDPVNISTPFPQNASDPRNGEKGNSSFDRRHRLALSVAWALPSPAPKPLQIFLGAWEVNGVIAAQSGQPFTPVNSSLLTPGGFSDVSAALDGGLPSNCGDVGGDGILFNDRPNIGNPKAPANTVALLNNIFCLDANNPVANAIPIVQGEGPYITPDGKTINPKAVRFVQVPIGGGFGNAGRNILTGPASVNFDLSLSKSFRLGERLKLQLRGDAYDLLNRRNPGAFAGNSYVAAAQKVPADAFYPRGLGVGPEEAGGPFLEGLPSLARVSGSTPMNSIDAVDPATGKSLFLSRQFLTTGSRRMQLSLKLTF